MHKIISIPILIKEGTTTDFIVHELTVEQLIELAQINPLFGGKKGVQKEESEKEIVNPFGGHPLGGFFGELSSIFGSGEKVIKMSCKFGIDDLKPLAPSDLQKIYEGFLAVNQTFLGMLEKLGILQVLKERLKEIMSDFSKMPVI